MEEVKELLGLGKAYEIERIEKVKINKIENKYIYLRKKSKKEKCSYCNQYTKSVHDKLKPIKIKYLKVAEYQTDIIVKKRRFICHKCNKKFTEKFETVIKMLNENLNVELISKVTGLNKEEIEKIRENL